jgi:biotin-(acetyl-CoA carboxylase) ligase
MMALSLPPAYHAIRLPSGRSAVAAAREAAIAGAAEGALFWADRSDRLDSALLLRPDRPRREMLPVIFVAALAFADALGSFAPPQVPIALGWPGDILIDGGAAGHISLDCAPGSDDAVPDWAVLHFDLTVAAAAGEPGRTAGVTSVADEGFEEFSVAAQLEGFSRHFLVWLNRWEADGFAPIAAEWWRRALGPAARLEVRLPGGGRAAARGLDDFGNLVMGGDGQESILSLAAALAPQARDG